MRPILFRGKINNSKAWQYGDSSLVCSIKDDNGKENITPFVTNTVTQFTGLKDVDDVRIFEGDFLQSKSSMFGYVRWNNESACFEFISFDEIHSINDLDEPKIIGNIFDNPELLLELF